MDALDPSMRSHKDVLECFIQTYRSEQCLWNIKSKEYRDRQRKEKGYARLIQILRGIEPAANRDHVVKKINNIRSSYRKEKKKVEHSLRNGAEGENVYQPKLWYYHLLRFLDDLEGDSEEYHEMYDEHMVDTVFDDEESSDVKNVISAVSTVPQSPVSNFGAPNRTAAVKRKSQYEVEQLTSEVFFPVEDHMKHPMGDEGDTFDIFGKLVACKLRNLPRQQQLLAEKIINDTLFEAEMGFLTLSQHRSVSSNHSQHQQPYYHNVPDQSRGQSSSPSLDVTHSESRSQRLYHHSSASPNAVQKIRAEEYSSK